MSYVDAGYAIALSVLALYAASLVIRRRRLERAAGIARRAEPEDAAAEVLDAARHPGADGRSNAVRATGTSALDPRR